MNTAVQIPKGATHKFGNNSKYLNDLKRNATALFHLRMLRCIAEGLTTKEMAPVLRYSTATVETLRIRLITHYGASNSCHLLKIAYDSGLLKPGEQYKNGELCQQ